VAETCERVVVMYAGQVIEEAPVRELFNNPEHPYTQGLIKSVPDVRKKENRLHSIAGSVPPPGSIQQGCKFRDRCAFAFDRCFNEDPPLYHTSDTQKTRCFLYDKNEEVKQNEQTTTES
ncbi:MAG TPA: oligopeptide/dipeptide ABC transporter ATP-binding protein, partial [Pseudogracilibacillus sp.]|nr:oligopeptide/dipeptide ABC transporter ATP-binding protein [Pseudogracilibacillus sp.]